MKNTLIIGANSSIAKAIVEQLASDWNIDTVSRDNIDYSSQSLQDCAQGKNNQYQLIINCIGVLHNDKLAPEKKIEQLDESVLAEYFRINTILPALCLRYFSPCLSRDETAKYINLSAMVGSISDNQLGGWYGYRSSKAALNMMVKTASIEIKRRNKNACIVAMHPGTTQTSLSKPFSRSVNANKYYTPAQSAERILSVAQRLTPEDTGKFFNWDGSQIAW